MTGRGFFHVVLLALAVAGIVLGVVDTIADSEPRGIAVRVERFFSYFTILSNALLAAYCAVVLRHLAVGRHPRFGVAQITVLTGIAITGLVYFIVLRPDSHPEGFVEVAGNALRHYVVPPLAVLGWAALGPWQAIGWRDLPATLAWPGAWAAYTFAHGAVTGWYPYEFIDVTDRGYGPVAVEIVKGAVEMLAVAALLTAVARRRTCADPH